MIPHRHAVAALAALASLAVATAASADSRFFTVRTDRPDVSVDQAMLNGQSLPVAGKAGGVTFFRLDNPAGAVSCGGNFQFSTSDGRRIQGTYDLCAVNWELTLSTGFGWVPRHGPGPASSGPATVSASGTRTVTIATDDPGVGITGVFLDKAPINILNRSGNTVAIGVTSGPGGIACQRDLGLKLSDGRVVAHQVNICANNWSVLFQLTGGSGPQQAGPPPPPPPDYNNPPPSAPDEQWSFFGGGGNLSLILGVPQTDQLDFQASCRAGTGQAAVSLPRAIPGTNAGRPIQVTLTAGSFSNTYSAVASTYSDISGGSGAQFSVAASDPLWAGLITGAQLVVSPGRSPPYVLTLRGSSGPTKQFLAACAPAPAVPLAPVGPPPGPGPGYGPGPGAGSLRYICDDGSQIRVAFNRGDGTATVLDPGSPPQLLPRIPSPPGRDVWAAGPFSLVGKDEEITWSRPQRAPRTCGLM